MALLQSLLKIQADLKAPKTQTNEFGGFNYRSCEDILGAVKPLCVREGVLLSLSDEVVMVGDWHYVKATASVTDGKDTISTVAYARETESRPKMDASQLTGGASSYSRKYALNGLFCIDDTKDADAMKPDADAMKPAEDPKEKPKKVQEENKPTKHAMLAFIVEEGKTKGVKASDFADIIKAKYHKAKSSDLTEAEVSDLGMNYMKYMSELVGG